MKEPKRDPLKPSTKDDRRDPYFMMEMTVMMTEAIIDGAEWHWRLRWWAWKRWRLGWIFWTPPRRVPKEVVRWLVTSVRAKIGH